MKLIIAYIQPEKLRDVKKELFKKEVYRVSVSNAIGAGQQAGYTETYRGVVHEINLLKKVRLEVAVNDDFVDVTVAAIVKGAKSGKIGDGKIFIVPLEECIRIRTGEKGKKAIG
ncbi:MAG: transcriptional regulator [Candidatus Saganbacteria bacterium]|nr:transcriptional regulator [Candidatus Saganbacteria bacterium]